MGLGLNMSWGHEGISAAEENTSTSGPSQGGT